MKKLLISLLFVIPVVAMQDDVLLIKSPSLQSPSSLGQMALYHHKKKFFVENNGMMNEINSHDIDPQLRKMDSHQLCAFLTNGYIKANKMSNGDLSLKLQGRLNGGGPTLCLAFYWTTKVLCYGTATAAVGGAVAGAVALAGPAGAAVVGGAAKVAAAGGGMGLLASAGTGAVASGITAAGGTAAATGATASVLTGAGGIAAGVAAVEGAACFMGAIGMAIPFL